MDAPSASATSSELLKENLIEELGKRNFNHSAYRESLEGDARPDATAWAATALLMSGKAPEELKATLDTLVKFQQPDGSIPLDPQLPTGTWPTTIATFAWGMAGKAYEEPFEKAVQFLISIKGVTSDLNKTKPTDGHDTTLAGWVWIQETHSWVEPTCHALMALQLAGLKDHQRCREARKLLIDRQLPSGGWNYGNTYVFETELKPFPESTGITLTTLQGYTNKATVQRSLDYLNDHCLSIKTPLTAAWSTMAKAAWQEEDPEREARLTHSYESSELLGPHRTSLLASLLCANSCRSGFMNQLQAVRDQNS